jgi:hypothetical protein
LWQQQQQQQRITQLIATSAALPYFDQQHKAQSSSRAHSRRREGHDNASLPAIHLKPHLSLFTIVEQLI